MALIKLPAIRNLLLQFLHPLVLFPKLLLQQCIFLAQNCCLNLHLSHRFSPSFSVTKPHILKTASTLEHQSAVSGGHNLNFTQSSLVWGLHISVNILPGLVQLVIEVLAWILQQSLGSLQGAFPFVVLLYTVAVRVRLCPLSWSSEQLQHQPPVQSLSVKCRTHQACRNVISY